MTHEKKLHSEPLHFAFFRGYLVTARPDGSVPLGSVIVGKVGDPHPMLNTLIAQANRYADEVMNRED